MQGEVGDPVTAPDLVEVVAEVLRVHGFTELEHGYWYCSCGHELGVLIPDDLHADHQAAAVLAALTEAGTVEWGALTPGRKVPYRYVKEQDARNSAKANHGAFVSRLTLPWTAVE